MADFLRMHGERARFKGAVDAVVVVLALLVSQVASAQESGGLPQLKRLYVQTLPTENGSSELYASLTKQLQKSGKFELVQNRARADAILKPQGQLWVKGHIAVNPRARENRQALYGGYLSAELLGRYDEVLWSYLVTPTKSGWSSVSDDLASNLVRQLIAAQTRKEEVATGGISRPGTLERTSLHGAGATFPAPLYQTWFESFESKHPNIQISYDAIGSEAGIKLLSDEKVDFAASDVPPGSDDSSPAQPYVRIASVLGGVVPIYNLNDVAQDLRFTPEVLAGIYLGKITRWNDPAIRAVNRGVSLPDAQIVVVHRSDGSGTTYVWSDFLSRTSADWKTAVGSGSTLNWPTGVGVEYNAGVAHKVQETPNAIGYVELVYAIQHQLSFGAIRNRSGEYVRASLESLAEAANSSVNAGSGAATIITNAVGKGAYPVATFTWLLFPREFSDKTKKTAWVEFLRWALTEGQRQSSALGFAPLPKTVAERQLRIVDGVEGH